jgi:hypothetical protein
VPRCSAQQQHILALHRRSVQRSRTPSFRSIERSYASRMTQRSDRRWMRYKRSKPILARTGLCDCSPQCLPTRSRHALSCRDGDARVAAHVHGRHVVRHTKRALLLALALTPVVFGAGPFAESAGSHARDELTQHHGRHKCAHHGRPRHDGRHRGWCKKRGGPKFPPRCPATADPAGCPLPPPPPPCPPCTERPCPLYDTKMLCPPPCPPPCAPDQVCPLSVTYPCIEPAMPAS